MYVSSGRSIEKWLSDLYNIVFRQREKPYRKWRFQAKKSFEQNIRTNLMNRIDLTDSFHFFHLFPNPNIFQTDEKSSAESSQNVRIKKRLEPFQQIKDKIKQKTKQK